MWGIGVSDLPFLFMTLLWLVFLEGLLSADNALVMAMMVRHLSKPLQKRVLWYGMAGAFVFRFIAVALANILLEFWPLKVLGGLYLLYLAVAHFVTGDGGGPKANGRGLGQGFWWTVISVEIADIAFSIDSILAAVAMSTGLPDRIEDSAKYAIVVTGGLLGILTMRFVAGYFIVLLDKFKGLEGGAYALVAWIGLKLTASGFHDAKLVSLEINDWVFWLGMLTIVIVSLIYRPPRHEPGPDDVERSQIIEDVARLASGGASNQEEDDEAAVDQVAEDREGDSPTDAATRNEP
jgi:YkoY family integral membrane protein